MKPLDILFISILRFSKKYRKGHEHVDSATFLMSLFLGSNFISILGLLDIFFGIWYNGNKYWVLIPMAIITLGLHLYFIRGKRYRRIIRKYYGVEFSKPVQYAIGIYVVFSIVGVFVIAPFRAK